MKKKFIYNTLSSLVLQAITIICGFILPRLILINYGSEINGLVQSISQFLGVITFLEMGVGQVVQSSLYSPLVQNDHNKISSIIKSAELFFGKIAKILFVYMMLLLLIYPDITSSAFDRVYVITLIIVIALSLFAQYYYGIVDNLLLNADQKVYIQNVSQILSVILNTCVCIWLMKLNVGIHIVKFITSIIYILRPALIRLYINKKYSINRNIKYEGEPIKQKWNGIAQHISGFILAGTDNIVLTIFSTLQNVSIYSVYYMIVYGVHQIYQAMMSGVHSMIGTLWAKRKIEKLNDIFAIVEMMFHFIAVYLFTCTEILIIPFVRVYTRDIYDINYVQPIFAMFLVLAHFFQCIKSIYNCVILAGGHYKETQNCHIVSAIINLFISILLVRTYGLIGVALGTCIAMLYQTVWMASYDSKNLLRWPFKKFIKQICVDIITAVSIGYATRWITIDIYSYWEWFMMALKVGMTAGCVTIIIACAAYPKEVKKMYVVVKNKYFV